MGIRRFVRSISAPLEPLREWLMPQVLRALLGPTGRLLPLLNRILEYMLNTLLAAVARGDASIHDEQIREGIAVLQVLRDHVRSQLFPETDTEMLLILLPSLVRYLEAVGPRRREVLFQFANSLNDGLGLDPSVFDRMLERFLAWGVLRQRTEEGTDWVVVEAVRSEGRPGPRAWQAREWTSDAEDHPYTAPRYPTLPPLQPLPGGNLFLAPFLGDLRTSLDAHTLRRFERNVLNFLERELERAVEESALLEDESPGIKVAVTLVLRPIHAHPLGDSFQLAMSERGTWKKQDLS